MKNIMFNEYEFSLIKLVLKKELNFLKELAGKLAGEHLDIDKIIERQTIIENILNKQGE